MIVPRWMIWNSFLALVPLGFALVLFRRPAPRRTVVWWLGCAAFLAFLPNAPYVLTDVVHLAHNVIAYDRVRVREVALFLAFFALGIASYTICVHLVVRTLRDARVSVRATAAVETGLHVACAAGVLVGRFGRFNSWDVLRPGDIVGGVSWLWSPVGVAAIVFGALLFATCTAVLRLACLGARTVLRPG